MTEPANATEARTVLDARIADKDFGAKVLAGDPTANREFKALMEKAAEGGDDVVDAAMAGKFANGPATADQRMMGATADMLRDMGFGPTAIRETLADKAPAQADIDRATLWKTQAMKNPDFVKRFLAGDGDAVREITAANIILTSAAERALISGAGKSV